MFRYVCVLFFAAVYQIVPQGLPDSPDSSSSYDSGSHGSISYSSSRSRAYDSKDAMYLVLFWILLLAAAFLAILLYDVLIGLPTQPEFRQNGITRRLSGSFSSQGRHPIGHSDWIEPARPLDFATSPEPSPHAAVSARDFAQYPSGEWRGYYTDPRGRKHYVCAFNLTFTRDGRVTGHGVDDIGHYDIIGIFGTANRRVAFRKQYIRGSRNSDGRIHRENKGHSVEYRGDVAGGTLGSGIRGPWSIRSTLGDYDGRFHIWPAMMGWRDAELNQHGEETAFEAAEGSECIVCFDRQIDTRLMPCGHVALCGVCVSGLNPHICPLCRSTIASVARRR